MGLWRCVPVQQRPVQTNDIQAHCVFEIVGTISLRHIDAEVGSVTRQLEVECEVRKCRRSNGISKVRVEEDAKRYSTSSAR